MSNIHHPERSLRKLRLTRVGAEWHALEKRALAEGWTPSRYLLTLCNEELLWRESEKLRRNKKEARLPVAKTLSEYDFSQVPELNGAQFRQLCETTDRVDAGENVLLFGASGLGKSHLAAAIVDGVIAQGYRARFYSAGELLQELRKARAQLKLNELLLKLDRYRVIVVDDLGYVKRDNAETGVLFELIAHRYERGSLDDHQ
ncbi:insertion sequence ATP-binding protein [Escherichia coli]|nr:insertion sequence ATP-binding protein [Escherichia coli]SQZ00258.1 insertion sequence ATP-binding protein [Escherichia coli]